MATKTATQTTKATKASNGQAGTNGEQLMASYTKALADGKLLQSQRQCLDVLSKLRPTAMITRREIAEQAAAAGEKIHGATGRLAAETPTFTSLVGAKLIEEHVSQADATAKDGAAARVDRRYKITAKGREALKAWKKSHK